ncbi:hypothetical protein [Mucilaginibacter terrae]|uniref:BlaI/MecI/CopY family transcriptional regulator n=1 Tax=Mucilaginibacter terrae TaxID=1955052 RepID=A0ABU3GZ93_9SPHI|nr:hypothetical protein [Mucilaginibacter terrae]MDT3405089.1 hypothetical protein [Mucilaginibacter terrae]
MNKADQSFNEEFKPVAPPDAFYADADWQDKVLYALAQLGEGTAPDVAAKLTEYAPKEAPQNLHRQAEQVLTKLYDKGLIAGAEQDGEITYSLSKITTPNTGKTDPDLL